MGRYLKMRLQTSIEQITADVDKHKLLISSNRPLAVLSSAVHNGGFKTADKIISIHVPEINDDNCNRKMDDLDKELHENPEIILKRALIRLNIDPDTAIGIMTHADVQNVEVSCQKHNEVTLSAFVTGGVEVASTAGELTISNPNHLKIDPIGTINVILLVDGNLTESCMVDTIKTIIEAKTVALRELDIRSYFSGDQASGTVTDSVVVACTKRGKPMKYAGTATVFGELVGKSVKEALKKTLYKEQHIVPDRPLIKRLKERKICFEKMLSLFVEAHPGLTKNSERFNKEVLQILSNPKISPFVIACFRLDDDLKIGLIPDYLIDKAIVVEVFQNAVINCIFSNNNSKQIKIEDANSISVANMGPFVGGILAAIMSCIYINMHN
jgi:adenosylcobinamide hydrolase